MSDITFSEEGKRCYVLGNTFPIKAAIKSAGGHWDGDRRAWWVGISKREGLEKAVGGAAPKQENADDIQVLGKASYKGRDYYVRWHGRCKSGDVKFRLVTLDGKIDFWADESACRWVKHYQDGEYNGRSTGYPTLGKFRRFIEEKKREESQAKTVQSAAAQVAAMTPDQQEARVREIATKVREIATKAGVSLLEPQVSKSLTRYSRQGPDIGEAVTLRPKNSTPTHWVCVAVGSSWNHTEDECEDQDCFCGKYGWRTEYTALQIEEPAEVRAEREAAEVKARAEADAHAAEVAAYQAAKAEIPADYVRDWGVFSGGEVKFDGQVIETITPVHLDLRGLNWQQVAHAVLRRATTGSIAGRVQDESTLYRAELPDGRLAFREVCYMGFGDDIREYYSLPPIEALKVA